MRGTHDWGVLRRSDDGLVLELVRETKGAEDPDKLQFAHEERKITCATAYFITLDIDYRHVTDETMDWWKPKATGHKQEKLL